MPTKTQQRAWPNLVTQAGLTGQAAIDGGYTPPSHNGTYRFTTDSFTGADNRNWKRQIRAGSNATTVASGEKSTRYGMEPQYYCFGYVNNSTTPANARRQSLCSGNLPLNPAQAGSAEEALVLNAARTGFHKKIQKIYTSFQGGVFLGELRETLHMIRRPAMALRREIGMYLGTVYKNAPKLKKMRKYRREQWVSNTWLEYAYGWGPLISDLDDARKYLDKRQSILYQEIKTAKFVAGMQFLREDSPTSVTIGPATIFKSRRSVDEYMIIFRGGVASRATGQDLINHSALGLSYRHFVPTLWELLPWSFVIDYFSNIGDVLSAWSSQRLSLAWGCQTTRRKRTADYIDQRGANNLTKVEGSIFIPGDIKSVVSSFTRVPISTPPLPSVAFEIPGFGIQWINMAALLNTRKKLGAYRLWV